VDETTLTRKGLLTVARTSRLMPDVPFVIAGRCTPGARAQLVSEGGPNLTVTGFVSDEDLDGLFRRARVYYQPSLHEAFGCSVAEAMLYNCLPVVTRRFALPEVVGPCGLYVEPDDPEAAVPQLRRALAGAVLLPERPRQRIRREYPSQRRREELADILDDVMHAVQGTA
jgi:glycosyltransferase involved in cell wall biosynthesis